MNAFSRLPDDGYLISGTGFSDSVVFFTEGYVLELRPKYNLNFEFLFSELQKTKPLNREDQGFGK
jgi:hypothetical protein